MQIDWQQAINDILSKKLSCPRCGSLADEVCIGYLRMPEASAWAPLCAHAAPAKVQIAANNRPAKSNRDECKAAALTDRRLRV